MGLDPMRNDGAPTTTFIRSVLVRRTTEERRCWLCDGVIPAGGEAIRSTTMTSDDDAPWTTYAHLEISDCLSEMEGDDDH